MTTTDADLRVLCEEVRRLDGLVGKPWIREMVQDGESLPDGTGYAGDWYEGRTVFVPPGPDERDCDAVDVADFIDPNAAVLACTYRTAAPLLAGECERLLGRVAEAEAAVWGLLCALGNHERAALDLMSMKWFAEAERDKALRRTREAEADAYRYGERAEKAEAEAARLRQEADEARESMEYAYQGKQRAREKTERAEEAARRLADAIGDAPHTPSCGYTIGRACDCWKSRALVPEVKP